jgi:uncharacterized protein (TIGR03000 family)
MSKPAAPGAATDARTKALEDEVRALKEQIKKLSPPKPGGGKPEETSEPAPAHVVVKLPEDARLFVDDKDCPLTSATRSFDTPLLKPGQIYYYTVRAEVTRAGRPITESKRVTLRAGEESVVEFIDLGFVQTAER